MVSRLIVISDTHDDLININRFIRSVRNYLNDSLIIHLGDITSPFTLKFLTDSLSNLIVVLGNNDGDKLLLKKVNPNIEDQPVELKIRSLRILLIHGFKDIGMTLRFVNALATSGFYDVILYGHTHKYDLRLEGDVLVMNPGTLSGYLASEATYGLIDLENRYASIVSLIRGEVVKVIKF